MNEACVILAQLLVVATMNSSPDPRFFPGDGPWILAVLRAQERVDNPGRQGGAAQAKLAGVCKRWGAARLHVERAWRERDRDRSWVWGDGDT